MRKTALFSALVPVLATGLTLLLPPQAAQAVADQTCSVNQTTEFNPPITDEPQSITVTVNGNLYLCTSSSASTGTYFVQATIPALTCTKLFGSGSSSLLLNWTNPAIADSTFTYNRTTQVVNGNTVNTFLGEIASGTFTPDPAQMVIAAPETDFLACSGTGVSSHTSNGTLTIGLL